MPRVRFGSERKVEVEDAGRGGASVIGQGARGVADG
jgi:hypothetical protein